MGNTTSKKKKKLHEVVKVVTYNLSEIINVDYFPTPEACHSSFCHRPAGIGVQGLTDTFMTFICPSLLVNRGPLRSKYSR
jgi:ribonucleotide reductase alpha subunit